GTRNASAADGHSIADASIVNVDLTGRSVQGRIREETAVGADAESVDVGTVHRDLFRAGCDPVAHAEIAHVHAAEIRHVTPARVDGGRVAVRDRLGHAGQDVPQVYLRRLGTRAAGTLIHEEIRSV